MKLSSLCQSPAALFLDNEPNAKVLQQSLRYRTNKKTLRAYCTKLETFYPLLISGLSSQKNSVLTTQQWMVLIKSISHIFLSFLIDITIVQRTLKTDLLVDDLQPYYKWFPQTQESLLRDLLFDQKLREQFFSIALQTRRVKATSILLSASLRETFSFQNLKQYIIKSIVRVKTSHRLDTKPIIAVIAAGPLLALLDRKIEKNFTFINLDSEIADLNSFPTLPDVRLRKALEAELEQILIKLNLPLHFPILGKRAVSAKNLSQLLSRLLPVQNIEKFAINKQKVERIIDTIKPKILITTAGHHDDLSNLFLSCATKVNIPLITMQHGSGYAEYVSMQTERAIETGLYPTEYLSWGKGMKHTTAIGSPYLNALPKYGFESAQIKRVLIPLEPIYFYQALDGFIPSQPGFIAQNYKVLIETLEKVHHQYPELLFLLKIKPGHERQYKIKQYLSSALLKNVEFSSKGKAHEYFDKETFVLIPTLSGAFHEALMAEVPFLLYLPRNQRFLNKDIDSFFEVLKKNFLCAGTVNELTRAFDRQFSKKVDYRSLQKEFEFYQDFACMRNPHWQKDLEKIIQKLLHHSHKMVA